MSADTMKIRIAAYRQTRRMSKAIEQALLDVARGVTWREAARRRHVTESGIHRALKRLPANIPV